VADNNPQLIVWKQHSGPQLRVVNRGLTTVVRVVHTIRLLAFNLWREVMTYNKITRQCCWINGSKYNLTQLYKALRQHNKQLSLCRQLMLYAWRRNVAGIDIFSYSRHFIGDIVES